jgi:hypothetical protein
MACSASTSPYTSFMKVGPKQISHKSRLSVGMSCLPALAPLTVREPPQIAVGLTRQLQSTSENRSWQCLRNQRFANAASQGINSRGQNLWRCCYTLFFYSMRLPQRPNDGFPNSVFYA